MDFSKERFTIEYKSDGVYLMVLPPAPGAVIPSPNDIIAELHYRKVERPDLAKIRNALERLGESIMIAPPQKEIVTDGACRVDVSRNKMEAYLLIIPPRGGQPVTRDDVFKAIEQAGVKKGIDEEAVDYALTIESMTEPIVIARGQPAVDGQPGKIDYKFNPKGMPGKPKELVDGRVDFYNLDLIQNVEAGQVLAEKIPPTEGSPGFNVIGEELLPRQGKDVFLAAGKNVELINDGLTAISSTNGHVVLQGNKISVSNVLEIKSDVDFSTGNIDFNGSVFVKGSVNDGFTVKADADIEIQGSVSGGFIHCGGNLKVKNGVIGRNKGMIVCRGSIYTQFIENASVTAGQDIVVGEAIMHSNVSAGKTVSVGGKGVIVGGIVRAGEEILAKIVGSGLATTTELEAGVNPHLRLEYAKAKQELVVKESELDKVDKALKLLKQMQRTLQDKFPAEKKAVLIKVSQAQSQLVKDVEALKNELENMAYQIEESEKGRIMVEGVLHSGVKVTIGSAVMQVQDDTKFVCLTKKGEEIEIASYK